VVQSLNGNVHVDRDSFFVMAKTSRTRGHSMKLYKPNSMSSFMQLFLLDSYCSYMEHFA